MASPYLLLVDDDALLRRSLAFNLERAGYLVQAVATAEEGMELAGQDRPALVLLDIGLPGMDGLEAMRHFQDMDVPVILLTARGGPLDEVVGLELGAYDYIIKPFDLDVLLSRIKATLRRSRLSDAPSLGTEVLVVGDLEIDPAARTVTAGGIPVELTSRSFDLLYVLASRPGQVLSVSDLLTAVWGSDHTQNAETLYISIRRLRDTLESDATNPRRIVSVRGVGYKLVAEPERE